jgi:hypothetical protein
VTEPSDRVARLRAVDNWFAERGFGIVITRDNREYWAHLFPKTSLLIAAPKYGRGATPELAAERARHRYEVEEGEPLKGD